MPSFWSGRKVEVSWLNDDGELDESKEPEEARFIQFISTQKGTRGIVEYSDGSVAAVHLWQMRFENE